MGGRSPSHESMPSTPYSCRYQTGTSAWTQRAAWAKQLLAGVNVFKGPTGEESRQRVLAALKKEPADRVPVFMWFHPSTAETLARLARLIAHYAPRTVIALGDSFHDRREASLVSVQRPLRVAISRRTRRGVETRGRAARGMALAFRSESGKGETLRPAERETQAPIANVSC